MSAHKVKVELSSEEERERFCNLLEFARSGRVIVGWEDADPDDWVDSEDPDDSMLPIYDDSDRSGDPLYPLAYALNLCSWYDYFPRDDHSIVVSCMFDQPGLLDEALSAAPVTASRQTLA